MVQSAGLQIGPDLLTNHMRGHEYRYDILSCALAAINGLDLKDELKDGHLIG